MPRGALGLSPLPATQDPDSHGQLLSTAWGLQPQGQGGALSSPHCFPGKGSAEDRRGDLSAMAAARGSAELRLRPASLPGPGSSGPCAVRGSGPQALCQGSSQHREFSRPRFILVNLHFTERDPAQGPCPPGLPEISPRPSLVTILHCGSQLLDGIVYDQLQQLLLHGLIGHDLLGQLRGVCPLQVPDDVPDLAA